MEESKESGVVKQGSLIRVCINNILALYETDKEARFTDAQLSEWLNEPAKSEEFNFAVMSVRTYLEKKEDIWLLRIRNRGYKIANDEERLTVIYLQKERRIENAMFSQISCLSGVERSKLDGKMQDVLDSRQRKTAFRLQAHMQIGRSKELGNSVIIEMKEPDRPKLF